MQGEVGGNVGWNQRCSSTLSVKGAFYERSIYTRHTHFFICSSASFCLASSVSSMFLNLALYDVSLGAIPIRATLVLTLSPSPLLECQRASDWTTFLQSSESWFLCWAYLVLHTVHWSWPQTYSTLCIVLTHHAATTNSSNILRHFFRLVCGAFLLRQLILNILQPDRSTHQTISTWPGHAHTHTYMWVSSSRVFVSAEKVLCSRFTTSSSTLHKIGNVAYRPLPLSSALTRPCPNSWRFSSPLVLQT